MNSAERGINESEENAVGHGSRFLNLEVTEMVWTNTRVQRLY